MPEETTATTGQEPVDGGAGEVAQVATSPAPAQTEATQSPATTAQAATGAPEAATGSDELAKLRSDFERTQRELEKVRKEAASNRVKGTQAEQALEGLKQALAKSLDIQTEEPKAPEELVKDLQSQLEETRNKYRQERLRGAFDKAAAQAGVDTEIAFAVMTLAGDLDNLDVEDASLTAELQVRMDAVAKRNPRIKLQVAAPATPATEPEKKPTPPAPQVPVSGTEFKGQDEVPLTRQMIKNMTPEEINDPVNWARISAALEKGLL